MLETRTQNPLYLENDLGEIYTNALKTTLVTSASWGAGFFVGAIPTIASLGLGAPGGVALGVLSGIAAGAVVDSAFDSAWKED